ncbi:MAG: hypothetical protein IJD46_00930 [Bacilli bacterium]|nr:hypothetical protein [Bacilli bacterium]
METYDNPLIKYDLLSVEALDKMHICLDLLIQDGYIKPETSLKETYEKVIGIYNLEREDKKMWKMVWNHQISSLFQMEKQSGIQGIALVKPESVDDLATLNSVIRLMAQEKGAEQPLNKFARFKANIDLWYDEMARYGLTEEEMKILEPIVKLSYGICESQEGFMQLVQMPECGGFDLSWADRLRKSIAKKNPADYEKLQAEYFARVEEKGLSKKLCNYVWNVLVATSRGYGFNKSHTLAYSLIALQEMNLAFHYPVIYWNTACLISDSGGAERDDSELGEDEEREDLWFVEAENVVEEFVEEDDEEDEEDEEEVTVKKKKKTRSANYGKIASAIGKMKSEGVEIVSPNINKSSFTFSPDAEANTIRFGLSGITRIGEELIQSIIENRPYESIEDFLKKVKINKPQMVNLIKAGAFDEFGHKTEIMKQYINLVSDTKKRITLQNMKMLIDFGLIPDEYDFQRRVYNFNKYVKKLKFDVDGAQYYCFDNIAFDFYEKHFDIDKLIPTDKSESGFMIKPTVWDAYYQKHMDIIRPFVKKHNEELLEAVNTRLTKDLWDKYCKGTLAKWEMDSVSCYFTQHELEFIDEEEYGFSQFDDLGENPEVESVFTAKGGKQVPLFRIHRIMGTVLDKDKAKKTVTLLTKTGVVTVKIYGDVYSHYDRQISEKNPTTGKKKVIEKSWFSRGNKIIVTGIRRDDMFMAKKYSRTPYHLVELITEVNGRKIKTCGERAEVKA